ncbi:hypothetical protein GCM10028806_16040 [Spirosoma terrae]|uniref:Large polyvalent protein associated domain-containing protein n=1 Tax=Spirosoma terrae TaxID=1968276 RepID=A0A6L9L7E4_9BACT|nr:hypothetical protein [Spirosoma terrae]NDU95252.1 hypothetical protein [Spirosoma terrae]
MQSRPQNTPGPTPARLPELRYSPDVVARMKATGVDPSAAEQRLAGLPRNEAETTWANVTDFYRRNTDASSRVAAYQGPDKNYLQTRASQPVNESWTGWNDLGSQFKNSFIDLSQGLADFLPSTVDLAMSAISNPSDTSWYRQWDKATDDYFNKAKYYVSPEAQAAVWDDKSGINWKAVAGMTGSTLGFLTTTMLPILGQVGRVGQAASAGSTISRILTDPRLQSGAIGYLQSLPGYKEAALKAGYTRNQAALIAPILSTASAALEFAGADALVKAAKLAPAEASAIVRQLSKESAAEAFQSMAGKQLTEEGFKDVINLTGKRFFDKLKLPEVRSAIFQNIRGGAISEGLEELTQQAAESAIQKMADTYYGYDAPGGKGFDPTVKEALINGVTGVLMGGIVGGSMGGMLGRTPTLVGQQTVWGKLDSDVRNLLNNNPDLDLANNKDGLDIYRLTDRLKSEGKLSDQEYQQARAGLDDMVRVSSRLANTKSDPQMRFALYNLDNQQRQWQQRMQAEVAQPMQRLAELADERAPGEWFPKPGLDTLDLAEATSLISQNLPKKQQLAERIGETINKSVSGLMNEQTRVQTLKSYQSDLDGLADQWENGVQSEPEVVAKPDQYTEADQPGLYRTMDTPDGRFALADTGNGREVFRVETKTDGAQSSVTEDTDPTIKRFRGYKLPSKGRPVVSLRTISDQTQHDELLNAFDANEDVTEDYADWRTRLSQGYEDNELDGLRQAEASYMQEAANLPADAPDWQKQDLARKRNWLKSAMASRAADSTESRYAQPDWISDYLGDELQQAGIDPDKLRELPIDTQSAISEALQTGDYQTANQLANDTVSDTTRPDELPAQLAAATERGKLLANAAAASQQVRERSAVVDQIEQALNAGELTADTEQQLISALADLETALRQESEAIAALDSIESGNDSRPEAGTGQQENGRSSIAPEQTAVDNAESKAAAQAEGQANVVSRPEKRTGEPKVIDRQPQDLQEAILQYFYQKGKIRRSDFARYADPNLMKGAKGGNPYLNYTAADENAESLDTIARQIVEEQLGRPVEEVDEQQVMQAIVDMVQSFATNGSPKQQLLDYQQQEFEQRMSKEDLFVAQATDATPLEALVPLMTGMDQAGVPIAVQDQLIRVIGEQYLQPTGLDWVGVIDLLDYNQFFATYPALQSQLLTIIDQIAQPVPITQAEYDAFSALANLESSSAQMSNDAWEQIAQQQHLSNSQYNQLIDLFYGNQSESTTPTRDDADAQSQPASTSEASQDTGLSEPGDPAPTAGGNSTPETRSEALTLTQQAQVVAAQSLLEADIQSLEQQTSQLTQQAQSLSQQLKAGKGQSVLPFNPAGRPVIRLRTRDVPMGFSDRSFVSKESGRAAIYELVETSPTTASYRVTPETNGQELALYDPYSYLDATEYANSLPPSGDVSIVTVEPGELSKSGNVWRITKKAVVRFESPNQSNVSNIEDSTASRIRDIYDQIEANNDRIKNLQDNKARLAEVADLAAQQATLLSYSDNPKIPLSPEFHSGLIARLKETFAGIADNVQIVDSNKIAELAEIETGQQLRSKGTVYGFATSDTVYLNSDHLNANTPIHEFGHFWNRWAKSNRADLYKEGIKKAKANAAYYEAIANDIFYQQQADRLGLSGKAREEYFAEEALATAIGDQGERFVSQAARKGFIGWLDRLWTVIKDKLGIENRTAQEIADMDLQEFSGGVAARLLESRPLSGSVQAEPDLQTRFSYGPAPTSNDQPARPITNQDTQILTQLTESFKAKAPERKLLTQQTPQQLADYFRQTFQPMVDAVLQYAPESSVAERLRRVRENSVTILDPQTGQLNDQLLASLAFELTAGKPKGNGPVGRLRDLLWEGQATKSLQKRNGYEAEPDLLTAYHELLNENAIIAEDGSYQLSNLSEEKRDATAAIAVYTTQSSDPTFVKFQKKVLTRKVLGNALDIETIGSLLSLGEGSALQRITKDIRRTWHARAAEVRLRRNHIVSELTEDLKGLSRFASPSGKIGDIGQVKTYQLSGWEDGKATTLDLPVSDWMDLYFTIKTQLTTTGKGDPAKATSSALADVVNGQLVTTRSAIDKENRLKKGTYGYQYTAPSEETPRTLLIDRTTYNQLEQLLQAEHGTIVSKVESLFADPVARNYVSGLFEIENGKPLLLEDSYYPTQTWTSLAERDAVPSGSALLEESRILRERKSPPLKVIGRDLLARISGYTNIEHRYIANSATKLNLERWRKRNAESLQKAPQWMTQYLLTIEKDMNDGGVSSPTEEVLDFEVAGVDLGLRAWMRRFSRSTFAFSLTTGPKQLLTHLNAYGMGIIENQYLRQAATDLGKLAVDSYKLARQSSTQSLFGGELLETSYLNEMAESPYMATILDRLTSADEAYLGRPTLDNIKAQPLNGSIAFARKAIHDVSDVGLRWVRASDRAVILSFWKAAQYQVQDKIAKGELRDSLGNPITDFTSDAALREVARLTEELTYATNTMSGEGNSTPLQRNKGLAGAMLGLYSGQQQKLVNTCVKAIDAYLKARAIGDPDVDQLRDKAIWTVTNLLLFNAVGVGMVNLLYRLLSGLLTGDEPQEDMLTSLSWDVGRGLLGSVPSVPTELMIAASTWIDGPRWSDEVLGYAPGQSFERVVDGMIAAKDYMMTDDPEVAAKRWNTLTYSLIDGSAHLLGAPVQIPKLLSKIAKSEPIKEEDWMVVP